MLQFHKGGPCREQQEGKMTDQNRCLVIHLAPNFFVILLLKHLSLAEIWGWVGNHFWGNLTTTLILRGGVFSSNFDKNLRVDDNFFWDIYHVFWGDIGQCLGSNVTLGLFTDWLTDPLVENATASEKISKHRPKVGNGGGRGGRVNSFRKVLSPLQGQQIGRISLQRRWPPLPHLNIFMFITKLHSIIQVILGAIAYDLNPIHAVVVGSKFHWGGVTD